MKRLLVLSMLSLATAGCTQSKGALLRGASYPPSPVALTPVPSIYDTVNAGVGGEAIAKTAIKNLDDPHWSGRAQVSVAARPVPPGVPNPPGGTVPAAGAVPAGPSVAVAQPQPAPGPPIGVAPATAALPVASALPPPGGQGPALIQAPPADAGLSIPAVVPTELAAVPEALSPLTPPPGQIDAGPPPLDSSTNAGALSTALSPVDAAVSPSTATAPVTATAAAPVPARGRDPLLGPDPDVLPDLPELPQVSAPAKQPAPQATPAPAGAAPASIKQAPPPDVPPPLEALPALPPALDPQPSSPLPSSPAPSAAAPLPPGPDNSAAITRPAAAGLAAVGLSLEAAPPSSEVSQPPKRPPAAAGGPGARTDPGVMRASAEEPRKPSRDRKSVYEDRGPVARVGDEIITYQDLRAAFKENLRKYPQLRAESFNSAEQMQILREKDMLLKQTLASLIDHSLLAQEAKRHIKDKKMVDRLYEEADKIWRTDEVLPLERQYKVDSESKLKELLAEEGRSLDTMRLAFRQYFLAESFLHEKLKDRIKVELPDLLRFYNEHLQDQELHRPAQITWRELVVEVEKYKSREEARRKANALLEKLRRGVDFQQLARAESDGPASSRKQGGLMNTTPGSYAVKSINDALDSLPIGQISGVLEGPDSFHILKVDSRKPAGPASFEEVQDQIRPALENQKYRDERIAYVAKLQKNALISVNLSMDDASRNSH